MQGVEEAVLVQMVLHLHLEGQVEVGLEVFIQAQHLRLVQQIQEVVQVELILTVHRVVVLAS
jgi:hypothetical protein